jgi:signal transduction histidine kinase
MLGSAPRVQTKKRSLVFLRWVVIVAASYLVLFRRPAAGNDPRVAFFALAFLASNVVAMVVPPAWYERAWLRAAFVLFDTAWISFGMYLAGEGGGDLFLLYFSVLFVAALGESEAMIAAGCVLISLLYLLFLLRTQPLAAIFTSPVLLRFPFLFGVGIFYGYLVTIAKQERRDAEMARERERIRTDLLATLTHDLQTPLSAIASMADLLRADPATLDETNRQSICESIKTAANESSELVATFLATASNEAGARRFPRQLVSLNDVAGAAIENHRRAAGAKNIRLRTHLADRLPPVSGDASELRRAVGNLVSNAIKFTSPGGSVEIMTAIDGAGATLTVIDDGPGISEHARKRLFEAYASNGENAGTGLGLLIVRLVAEAHGGSVTVKSDGKRGSTFVIRIPVAADADVDPVRMAV